ncbi:hypothetical protein HDU67_000435 [Dinochytrium kinnereticum]|nr:hypothetical protein HDU67_000435 [Dinochytrium kinnereticum]
MDSSSLGIDALIRQLLDNPSSPTVAAQVEDTNKLAMVLKILEESRKLKEEERKGNEVQLEILKVLSTNQSTSSLPSIPAPVTTLGPSPSLEMLLASNSLHHQQDHRVAVPSPLDSIDFLTHGTELGSDLSMTGFLNQSLDLEAPSLPTPDRGFHLLQDFELASSLSGSGNLNGGSAGAGGLPDFSIYARMPSSFSDPSGLLTADGTLNMSAFLDLDSLTHGSQALDSLGPSPELWHPTIPSNYHILPSKSPSPITVLDGSSKKKALFRGGSQQTPISHPVISMVTPLVFAVEGDASATNGTTREEELDVSDIPATPVEAFRFAAAHAAAQASSRRKTVEESCVCILCGAQIGLLHLRGTQKTLETVMVVVDIKCEKCAGDGSGLSLAAASKTRKRYRENPLIECEVCRKNLGSGAVRLADEGTQGAATAESRGIEVEVVCEPCGSSYLFCSECGGGGKSRTGKWRPKELFSKNRKTCSLPHIRIGNAVVLYRVLEVPKELSSGVMRGVKDVFFDCLLSLYAIPSIIETPRFGSYLNVRSEVEQLWNRTVEDAITNDLPTGLGGGKMYLTVAWIEKRHRNRGKGKNAVNKAPVPWLQKLALEGTVAPLKQEPASPNMNDDVRDAKDSPPPAGIERCYTAFAIFEWDRAHGSLFILQMAPRSIFVPTMESYGELIRRGVERVQADVRRDNAPSLEHLWCWTRAEEHARLKVIPERLGFVPVEQYVRANPAVDRNGFEREGYGPLKEEGVSIYATSIKDFLKLRFLNQAGRKKAAAEGT